LVIISAAPITATNDPKRWMVFVNAAKGESIVLCGLVNKPNPVGVPLLRQLILTSHKRLIYVDANSLELKGTIEWKKKKAIKPLVLLVRGVKYAVSVWRALLRCCLLLRVSRLSLGHHVHTVSHVI
jgi:hypothetical protein